MEDFWRLVIRDEYFSMRQPAIDANNFELKPALNTMMQQYQYTCKPLVSIYNFLVLKDGLER